MFINIKPNHKGLFTRKAKAAGMSVPAYAKKEAYAPGVLGKRSGSQRTAERVFRAQEEKEVEVCELGEEGQLILSSSAGHSGPPVGVSGEDLTPFTSHPRWEACPGFPPLISLWRLL